MLAPGDTVVLQAPAGVFLRRQLHFGLVTAIEDDGRVQVVWDHGQTAVLAADAALLRVEQPSDGAAVMVGKYARAPGAEGVVVAAYAAEGTDYVVIETTLGLVHTAPASTAQTVPNRSVR